MAYTALAQRYYGRPGSTHRGQELQEMLPAARVLRTAIMADFWQRAEKPGITGMYQLSATVH